MNTEISLAKVQQAHEGAKPHEDQDSRWNPAEQDSSLGSRRRGETRHGQPSATTTATATGGIEAGGAERRPQAV